jgi:hypothetical protein
MYFTLNYLQPILSVFWLIRGGCFNLYLRIASGKNRRNSLNQLNAFTTAYP